MSGYEVGYRKPPKETRFQKGRSGNPKGRPRGSKNKPKPAAHAPGRLHALVLEEAFREVEVKEGGRTLTMPIAQLTLRSLSAKAAKGDVRSQKLLVEMLALAEAREQRAKEESFETLLAYKEAGMQELARRKREGLPPPDPMPLPHPDDIYINPRTGEAEIQGPVTEEELAAFEMLKRSALDKHEEVEALDARHRRARSEAMKAKIAEERARVAAALEALLDMMDTFSERWPKRWPLMELELWRSVEKVRRGEEIGEETMQRVAALRVREMLQG